jgi:hypothetical protein
MKGCFCTVVLLALLRSTVGDAAPVLMISVDGMKPEYVLEARASGLKIPFLRRLAAEGAYAEGVMGVWPTVTYPSHTTLVTGVAPAEHGIYSNLEFDPYQRFKDSWFWYARQVRVPTLWQAAHAQGITTASIGWPVTVGAIAAGRGIAHHRSLGVVDMRQVAPTIAQLLGIGLPSARSAPLRVSE